MTGPRPSATASDAKRIEPDQQTRNIGGRTHRAKTCPILLTRITTPSFFSRPIRVAAGSIVRVL